MHRSSTPRPSGGAELCLRFECEGCRDLLFLPVEDIRRGHRDRCPKCHQPVRIPSINETTAGYRRIVPKIKAKVVDCPQCRAPLRVPPGSPGKREECPACRTTLTFQLVTESQQQPRRTPDSSKTRPPATPKSSLGATNGSASSPPLESTINSANRAAVQPELQPKPVQRSEYKPAARSESSGHRPAQSPSPPPAQAAADPGRASPSSHSKPQQNTSAAALAIADSKKSQAGKTPLIYHGQTAPAAVRRSILDLSSSPRIVWRLIYFALWLGPPVMSCGLFVVSLDNLDNLVLTVPLTILSWGWFLVGWRICSYLANILSTVFITTFRCPGCGEHHEAVGRWNCGCGYNDHRERHALSRKCPKCSEYPGFFDCAQCGSTIFIR